MVTRVGNIRWKKGTGDSEDRKSNVRQNQIVREEVKEVKKLFGKRNVKNLQNDLYLTIKRGLEAYNIALS